MTSKVNIRVGQAHRLLAQHARQIMSSALTAIQSLTHEIDRYGAMPTADDVNLYLIEMRDLLGTIDQQRIHLGAERALKAVDDAESDEAPIDELAPKVEPPPNPEPSTSDDEIPF